MLFRWLTYSDPTYQLMQCKHLIVPNCQGWYHDNLFLFSPCTMGFKSVANNILSNLSCVILSRKVLLLINSCKGYAMLFFSLCAFITYEMVKMMFAWWLTIFNFNQESSMYLSYIIGQDVPVKCWWTENQSILIFSLHSLDNSNLDY